jgi:hypothetical protein
VDVFYEGRVIPKPAIGINIKGLTVVIALWMFSKNVEACI